MRLRTLISAAAALLIVGLVPAPAGAQVATDTSAPTVTASITGTLGTRVLTGVGAIAMSSAVGTATLTSAPFAVLVTEAARSGTVGWYVTAEMTTPLASSTPNPTATIANSALTLTPSAMTSTPATGTDAAGNSTVGNLGGPTTIWTNTGQVTTTTYTGTHSNSPTITLRPPNGTVNSPSYVGVLTVTLFQ